MLFLKFTISRKFKERLNLVTISTHSNLSLSHGVYDFNLNYLDDRFCSDSYTPLPIPHRAPPTTRRKPHLHLRLSIKDPSPPNPKNLNPLSPSLQLTRIPLSSPTPDPPRSPPPRLPLPLLYPFSSPSSESKGSPSIFFPRRAATMFLPLFTIFALYLG